MDTITINGKTMPIAEIDHTDSDDEYCISMTVYIDRMVWKTANPYA